MKKKARVRKDQSSKTNEPTPPSSHDSIQEPDDEDMEGGLPETPAPGPLPAWPYTYSKPSRLDHGSSAEERERVRRVKLWWDSHPDWWDPAARCFDRKFSVTALASYRDRHGLGAAAVAREGLVSRFDLLVVRLMTRSRPLWRSSEEIKLDALMILFAERAMTDPSAEYFDDAVQVRLRINLVDENRTKWAELVNEALVLPETSTGDVPHTPDDLHVNLDVKTATLAGKVYPLTEQQTEILDALIAAGGGWVRGKALERLPSMPTRPDRVISKMPEAVKALIESQRGQGRRLRTRAVE